MPAIVLMACAAGPNPTGVWNGSVDSPQGPFDMRFDLGFDGGAPPGAPDSMAFVAERAAE